MPGGRHLTRGFTKEPAIGPPGTGPITSQVRTHVPMTHKQLGYAVYHGRRLTFTREAPHDPVTGYLGGIDEANYLVLVPQQDSILPRLLSRSGILDITLHPESTLSSESLYPALEKMLSPFREWVRTNYLRMDAPKSR